MAIDGGLFKLFQRNMPEIDMQRVETGGTGRGIPDINYCGAGREGWVEFKQTAGNSAGLRPEQIGWIERRVRHGGRVFVAVRRTKEAGPRRGPATDALFLFPGSAVRALHDLGVMSVTPILAANGPPQTWPWLAIQQILLEYRHENHA